METQFSGGFAVTRSIVLLLVVCAEIHAQQSPEAEVVVPPDRAVGIDRGQVGGHGAAGSGTVCCAIGVVTVSTGEGEDQSAQPAMAERLIYTQPSGGRLAAVGEFRGVVTAVASRIPGAP